MAFHKKEEGGGGKKEKAFLILNVPVSVLHSAKLNTTCDLGIVKLDRKSKGFAKYFL